MGLLALAATTNERASDWRIKMEYVLLNITTMDIIVVFRKKGETWRTRTRDHTGAWDVDLGPDLVKVLEETLEEGLLTYDDGPLEGYEFRKITEEEAIITIFTEPMPLVGDLVPLFTIPWKTRSPERLAY